MVEDTERSPSEAVLSAQLGTSSTFTVVQLSPPSVHPQDLFVFPNGNPPLCAVGPTPLGLLGVDPSGSVIRVWRALSPFTVFVLINSASELTCRWQAALPAGWAPGHSTPWLRPARASTQHAKLGVTDPHHLRFRRRARLSVCWGGLGPLFPETPLSPQNERDISTGLPADVRGACPALVMTGQLPLSELHALCCLFGERQEA